MPAWTRSNPIIGLVLLGLVITISSAPAQLPSDAAGPSFGKVNPQQMARMMNPEKDGPFYMVNLIQYREKAIYADGRQTDLTGAEADALYSPVEILHEIGAQIVFVAQVERNLPLGDGTQWDRVAIVRYPSRREFLQMTQRPDFQAKSIHKDAGLEKSIVMVTHLADLALPEDFVPPKPTYPATAEDPAFEMIHVLRYRDVAQYEDGSAEPAVSGREAMQKYSAAAGDGAAPMGVYPVARFEVEGVLIGDGREWDEVRINHFPSHTTLEKHLGKTARAESQHHRTAAVEDTYALQTLAAINTLDRN